MIKIYRLDSQVLLSNQSTLWLDMHGIINHNCPISNKIEEDLIRFGIKAFKMGPDFTWGVSNLFYLSDDTVDICLGSMIKPNCTDGGYFIASKNQQELWSLMHWNQSADTEYSWYLNWLISVLTLPGIIADPTSKGKFDPITDFIPTKVP